MTPDAHKIDSGLFQMILMGESIRHKWVDIDHPAQRYRNRSVSSI